MFVCKQHRFYCEGVSFVIPDGYYLDTEPAEVQQDMLNLWRNSKKLHINIGIERETSGPIAQLLDYIQGLEATAQVGPELIRHGGMSGYWAVYDTGNTTYCEYRLYLSGDGDNQTEFLFLIIAIGDARLTIRDTCDEMMAAFDIQYDGSSKTE